MRTADFGTGHIEYPDEIAFAYNPVLIKIDANKEVTFEIRIGEVKVFRDKRTSIKGKLEIDISQYTQVLFDTDSGLIGANKISVTASTDTDSFEFTTDVIFGAMNVGEIFNAPRTVTWFKKFPFTISMYVPQGSTVQTRYDKTNYVAATLQPGLQHVNPSTLFNPSEFGVIRVDWSNLKTRAGTSARTFDYTFDYTFEGTFKPVGDGTLINRLIVDNRDCGVYLRWIDRHGFYQYYLFSEGEDTEKSKNVGEPLYFPWQDGNIYYDGVGRYVKKGIEHTKKLCAVLIDEDSYNMVKSVCTSPAVDMYIGDNRWLPVTVSDISIMTPRQPLSDLEIEIKLPDIQTQRL